MVFIFFVVRFESVIIIRFKKIFVMYITLIVVVSFIYILEIRMKVF